MALYVSNVSDEFILKLAQEYLEPYQTMAGLAKRYSSSPSTISNILYKGVVNVILNDITATAIANKITSYNENVIRSYKRWKKALDLRDANILEAQLTFFKHKLQEIKFQLDSYDNFFFDEYDSITREDLLIEKDNVCKEIKWFEDKIKELRG